MLESRATPSAERAGVGAIKTRSTPRHEWCFPAARYPAITYAENQWQALTTYATQGFLSIDNNAGERVLKRVAIGQELAVRGPRCRG